MGATARRDTSVEALETFILKLEFKKKITRGRGEVKGRREAEERKREEGRGDFIENTRGNSECARLIACHALGRHTRVSDSS